MAELSETLDCETETETWVVSVLVLMLETSPWKAESQSQCLVPQIKVSVSVPQFETRDQKSQR